MSAVSHALEFLCKLLLKQKNMVQDKENFIKNLPKVELHAHINGSLSNETLSKLGQLKNETVGDTKDYTIFESLPLNECFEKFKFAHALTDTPKAVALATECVIRDFNNDHVVYVELRTTPRATTEMTKDQYLTAVIHSIEKMKSELPNILVKLIISINRRESLESARENVDLAIKYKKMYPNIVCGMDLSGDPNSKTFNDFKDLFDLAKNAELKLALHCGEVENSNEITMMLDYGMNRLGHGTFISGTNEVLLLQNNDITLECCLTSNLLCGVVKSYVDHHFWRFFKSSHPVVICTDDFGVFNTTLSKEIQIALETFDLTFNDLIKLSLTAINSSFGSESEKSIIRSKIEKYAEENLLP